MTTKKVKDLRGKELDMAMAIALGFEMKLSAFGTWRWYTFGNEKYPAFYNSDVENFHPTKDWKFMGTLIDEHGIEFKWVSDATVECYSHTLTEYHAVGHSHLEAACRLLVLSFVGEEIEIPVEVMEAYNGKSTS